MIARHRDRANRSGDQSLPAKGRVREQARIDPRNIFIGRTRCAQDGGGARVALRPVGAAGDLMGAHDRDNGGKIEGSDRAAQYVRADERVPFGAFASVMDAVKRAGITNISIVTQPLESTPSADTASK